MLLYPPFPYGTKDLGTVSGLTLTVDWREGISQQVTLAASITLTLTQIPLGERLVLGLRQDGAGGRAVLFAAPVVWEGGAPPTLSTDADKTDILVFVNNGGKYCGQVYGLGY